MAAEASLRSRLTCHLVVDRIPANDNALEDNNQDIDQTDAA